MGLNDFGGNNPISSRPLEFIWVLDVSGSMSGDKIQSLNFAITEAIPEMKKVARDNVNATVFVRAIAFGSQVRWHIAERTPVENFTWSPLSVSGCTNMGAALEELATALDVTNMPDRGLPPVVVLVSDGGPTDNFDKGLKTLMSKPWGKKAIRLAVAIGEGANKDVLAKFIGNPEISVLEAHTAAQLVGFIRWASTQAINSASASQSSSNKTNANVQMPPPPTQPLGTVNSGDVW